MAIHRVKRTKIWPGVGGGVRGGGWGGLVFSVYRALLTVKCSRSYSIFSIFDHLVSQKKKKWLTVEPN